MIGEGREKKKRKRSIIVVLVHIHSLARFSPPFFLSFITRVMVSSAFNSQLTARRQREVSVSLIFPFFFSLISSLVRLPACLPGFLLVVQNSTAFDVAKRRLWIIAPVLYIVMHFYALTIFHFNLPPPRLYIYIFLPSIYPSLLFHAIFRAIVVY